MKNSSHSAIFLLLLLTFVGQFANAQTKPVISYQTPQVYTVGNAITPLAPTNTGGAVPATIYGNISTLAGNGRRGDDNGTGRAASFGIIQGATTDAQNNFYVADPFNNKIKKITQAGVVTTFAGTGDQGSNNGGVSVSSFYVPTSIVKDAAGNFYVSDKANNMIRKITPEGIVSTFAGNTSYGNSDGTGTSASFYNPHGLAIDAAGNIYVADAGNKLVRKITPGGVVSTIAGGNGEFYLPVNLTVDTTGNVYVTDSWYGFVKKITPDGIISIVAGNGASGSSNGDGQAIHASFNTLNAITIDRLGNLFVGDLTSVRKITQSGAITTFAGILGVTGYANGLKLNAKFSQIMCLRFNNDGDLYAGDVNYLFRKITLSGYDIDKTLPPGLTFDSGTGIISGTPTSTFPPTTFTVTAYNPNGSSQTTFHLQVRSLPVPAAPAIAYAGPQHYTLGKPVSTLTPTNTGGAIPVAGTGGYAQVTTLASELQLPVSVAVDKLGNKLVGLANNQGNFKIADDGTISRLGITGGNGIATDDYGVQYSSGGLRNVIIRHRPEDGTASYVLAGNSVAGSANGIGTAATFSNPHGIASDAQGNVYVADYANNMIRKITPDKVVTTVAGNTTAGSSNGTGVAASFRNPYSVAVDSSGNIYVADYGNNMIRKISSAGVVTTLAGSTVSGSANGLGTAASFKSPAGIAVDRIGNVYVGDSGNNLIRKITPDGAVTTLAGNGQAGILNETGLAASFSSPRGLAFDEKGDLYVADYNNNAVRKISLKGYTISPTLPTGLFFDVTTGQISGNPAVAIPPTNFTISAYNTGGESSTTLSIDVSPPDTKGVPVISYAGPQKYIKNISITPLAPASTGGTIPQNAYLQVSTLAGAGPDIGFGGSNDTAYRFNKPAGIVMDGAGNIYIADEGNRVIRKRTPAGKVTVFAGSGALSSVNGTGTAASFSDPREMAIDAAGNIYVSDNGLNLIRKITPGGVVTTYAGSTAGYADGTNSTAKFGYIAGITISSSGTMYVSDQSNYRIRKITPDGIVSTFAGSGLQGQAGHFQSTTRAACKFYHLGNLVVQEGGAAGVYVVNGPNDIVYVYLENILDDAFSITYDSLGNLSGICMDDFSNTYAIGNNKIWTLRGSQKTFLAGIDAPGSADGVGSAASFNSPFGITLDATKKNLFITDKGNNLVRKINLSTAIVTTVVGKITLDGTGTSAKFNQPAALATDGAGNVYVADTKNNLVRKMTPAGVVTTFAGTGLAGSANGEGTVASFASPQAVAVDAAQNIYIGDNALGLVRKITPGGVVTVFAGSTKGFANGTGTAAQFGSVTGLATDGVGNIYVADAVNRRIRKITPAGVVTTFAGSGVTGSANGVGTGASFIHPVSLTIDGDGNMFVSDSLTVRKITKTAIVSTFAGSGTPGSVDARGILASFTSLAGITSDGTGSIYVIDGNTIRKITHGSDVSTISGRSDAGSSDGEGIAASFNHPYGLTADAFGNLYVGDTGNSLIRKINLTGYVIRPKLPDGLVFDSKTGIISGTPTVLSPPTDYTISGYNGSGNGSATVNIEVSETDSLITRLAANEPMVKQALSPNGDGINNALIINNIEKYPNNKLILMNNSGNTIYQVTGYDNSSRVFDGHSNITKALQQPGTYYYMLEYSSNGSIKRKTGYFVIKY